MPVVSKTIYIRTNGSHDLDYKVSSDGHGVALYVTTQGKEFGEDPDLWVPKDEASALARAISELANGY
jgi:hypothetical protein